MVINFQKGVMDMVNHYNNITVKMNKMLTKCAIDKKMKKGTTCILSL